MSEYIKTIVTAVLAVGMISVLFPKGSFGKYVSMLSGIIVMAVVAFPLLNIDANDIDFDILNTENLEIKTNSYIMEEFEKELARKIQDELKSKTNIEFSAVVFAEKKDNIITINKVEISPYSEEYVRIVSQYTGIEEGRILKK